MFKLIKLAFTGRQMSDQYASITTNEGEKMETTQTTTPEYYNPNQIISYKSIEGDTTFYPVVKITDLEMQIHNSRERIARLEKTLQVYTNQFNDIIDNLSEDNYYSDDMNKEDVLESLCAILEYEPVKEVSWTATLRVEGRSQVPLAEGISDFLNSIEFSTDAWNGDVIVEDTQVLDIEEN
jgi:TolA-binding protein